MPVTIMYVETKARAVARAGVSTSTRRPRVKNRTPRTANTTADETLDRIVKKLKKFAVTVATSRSRATASVTEDENCAPTATRMSTAIATRAAFHPVAHPRDLCIAPG